MTDGPRPLTMLGDLGVACEGDACEVPATVVTDPPRAGVGTT